MHVGASDSSNIGWSHTSFNKQGSEMVGADPRLRTLWLEGVRKLGQLLTRLSFAPPVSPLPFGTGMLI